jgi:DNA-binding transcriptional regulator of glucitol operon
MVDNRWQERNLDADRSRDLELRRREVDEISEMRIRHIRMGLDLQDLGHAQLKRYIEMLESMADTGELGTRQAAREFKPKNIVEFIEAGTKLERLNLDMAESITEHRVDVTPEEDQERSRQMLHSAKVRKAMKTIAKEIK